jgi:hypothetical protein
MVDSQKGMKVYPTWELLEKTDPAEWDALSDTNKQIFHLIVSAGTVYFTNGGSMRDVLLNIFPVGTLTGDRFRLM